MSLVAETKSARAPPAKGSKRALQCFFMFDNEEKKMDLLTLSFCSNSASHARAKHQGKAPTRVLLALRDQIHLNAGPGAPGLWLGGVVLFKGEGVIDAHSRATGSCCSIAVGSVEALLRRRVSDATHEATE